MSLIRCNIFAQEIPRCSWYVVASSSSNFHTGGIDSFWTILRNGVPPSLRSNVNGRANPALWLYACSTHWRWENDTANLMHKTGQTLRQLWAGKRENESASFLTTKCCKGCSETQNETLFLVQNYDENVWITTVPIAKQISYKTGQ